MKQRRTPYTPIFRRNKVTGAVSVGTTPGTEPNDPPVACFTFDDDFLHVEFDASCSSDADGSIVGWQWDFGDGNGSTSGPTVTHNYASAGSYDVELVVEDDQGAFSAPFTDTVMVAAPSGLSVLDSVQDATNLDGPMGLAIQGGLAYVTGLNSNSVAVVDISNPAALVVLNSIAATPQLTSPEGIVVDGDYAYVCAHGASAATSRFTIVNVANPLSLSIESSIAHAALQLARRVVKDGDLCYATGASSDSLAVIDVSNPASPSVIGSVADGTDLNDAVGLYKVGDIVYVTGSHLLTAVDVSNPASPSIISTVSDATTLSNAADVVVDGDYAYVMAFGAARITVVDVSNPASMSIVGSVSSFAYLGSGSWLVKSGNYVYATGRGSAGTAIIDVSNPASPSVVTGIVDANLAGAEGIAKVGSILYVCAFSQDRLTTLTIS